MSEVTDVIVAFGLCDDEVHTELLLAKINACCSAGRVFSVDDRSLPAGWYYNRKASQVNVAIGSFNGLDLKDWIRNMRTSIEFSEFNCGFVQLIVQDQHHDGFGVIEVWRGDSMPVFTLE